jgi:hypothetical protein
MRNSSQHLWNGAAKRCAICEEGSASSAATPAKRPSVRRGALTALCVARKMTVDGYVGFQLPDFQGEIIAAFPRRFGLPSQEVVQ